MKKSKLTSQNCELSVLSQLRPKKCHSYDHLLISTFHVIIGFGHKTEYGPHMVQFFMEAKYFYVHIRDYQIISLETC